MTASGQASQPAALAFRPSPVVFALALAFIATAVGLGPGGPIIAAAGIALGAGVLVSLRPDAATILVLAIIYSNAAVVAVRFHGVPDFAAAVLPAALIVPLGHHVLVRRQPIVLTSTAPWLAMLLVVQLLSAYASQDVPASATEVMTFVTEGLGLFLLLVNVIRTPAMLRAATWTILVVGAALGALSVYQQLTGSFTNNYLGFAQIKDAAGGFFTGVETLVGRARQPDLTGPIGDQNFYAQFMLMLIPIGVARTVAERGLLLKVLAMVATALVGLGVLLTFSRGAAIAGVIIFIGMIVLRLIHPRAILVAIVAVVLALVAFPQYATRVATLDVFTAIFSDDSVIDTADASLRSRATENIAAALVFIDHPLLGVGPGQFPTYYGRYANEIGLEVQATNRQAHTLYFGIGAELGVGGLIAFLAALGMTIRELFRSRKLPNAPPELVATCIGLILALAAFMLTGLFLHLAFARYLWTIVAIAAAAAVITRDAARRASAPEAASRPA